MTTDKPEVVRYEPQEAIFGDRWERAGMEATADGNWVALDDYEALQAEYDRLRSRARAAEREYSKVARTLKDLERVAKVVSDHSDEVCADNSQLRAECEQLRKDAARYRWLRSVGREQPKVVAYSAGAALDYAIDAAIEGKTNEAK